MGTCKFSFLLSIIIIVEGERQRVIIREGLWDDFKWRVKYETESVYRKIKLFVFSQVTEAQTKPTEESMST